MQNGIYSEVYSKLQKISVKTQHQKLSYQH